MCGIAGIVSLKKITENSLEEYKKNVLNVLLHRGPDSYGTWNNNNVLFLHRRLKIIDLDDRANQPFQTKDGRYRIVFNGEIYNYKSLAKKHLSDYVLKTESDTEVLLLLFEKFGLECVNLLRGIFAFAIIDVAKDIIYIARDNYGVKPLYYYFDDNIFIFASEIKAIFSFGVKAELNDEVIAEQLIYGYVAGSNTIYKNIKRLLPGTFSKISFANKLVVTSEDYFDATKNKIHYDSKLDDKIIANSLKEAVISQTLSDVPVGFMCSGGIDSSLISAIAASNQNFKNNINTYCAKISEKGFDESYFSQIVANHIGSKHSVIESEPADITRLISALIWAHDEPLKHPNSIPIYLVNKRAKEDVTVLLTGEGADEIFGGYWVFPLVRKLEFLRKIIPKNFKRILLYLFKRLGRQAKTIQAMMSESTEELYVNMGTSYDKVLLRKLSPNLKLKTIERLRIAKKAFDGSGKDVFQGFLFYYQQTHLTSLFDRQDKMSMINAIEGRVPYVDVDLVKLVNSLPYDRKIKGGETKVILRKIAKDFLPKAIFNRDKYAFALPIYSWMKKSPEFNSMLDDVSEGYLVQKGYIIKNEYNRLLKQLRNGNSSLADVVWNILNLELSAQIFVLQKDIVDFDEFKHRK